MKESIRKRDDYACQKCGIQQDELSGFHKKLDIRHRKTMTPIKMALESFIHKPTGWQESTIDKLPGWNIKELFKST